MSRDRVIEMRDPNDDAQRVYQYRRAGDGIERRVLASDRSPFRDTGSPWEPLTPAEIEALRATRGTYHPILDDLDPLPTLDEVTDAAPEPRHGGGPRRALTAGTEPAKVYVFVDQASAIKKGVAYWGPQEIDLAAVLALLTEDERAHLRVNDCAISNSCERFPCLAVISWASSLTVPSTDPADVVADIRECLKGLAQRQSDKSGHDKTPGESESPNA